MQAGSDLNVDQVRTLILDGVAHGGYAVGRDAGRVVFVRGGISGEEVRVRITRRGPKGRFWYADVVEVLRPAVERVEHPWPIAALPHGHDDVHPASEPVGGLDLGHISLAGAREWKSEVVRDQLRRLGRVDWPDLIVEGALGDDERGGLRSRTRVQLAVDEQGRAGMRPYRSHDVVPLQELPIATEAFDEINLFDRRWPANSKLQVALPSASAPFVAIDGQPWSAKKRAQQRRFVRETVTADWAGERLSLDFQVAGTGFWQVHRKAPRLLVEAVLAAAEVNPGEQVLDLYSGVGLFAGFLSDAVGPAGRVTAVETDGDATRAARRNFHDRSNVNLVTADVRRAIAGRRLPQADVVVLDPPRAGATAPVVRGITELNPRKIVHVSCDPATFARDVATYYELGWEMTKLRAFDIYPLTHHVETLAVFERLVS